MNPIRFRQAGPEDLSKIVDIYNSSIETGMSTADLSPSTVESKQEWFEKHNPQNRPLLLMEHSQEIIGWCSFRDFYGRPAYQNTVEVSLYLHPDYQGKGFGRELLSYALGEADKLGLKKYLAFIFSHNIPSIKLFESMGFESWGKLPEVAEMGDNKRDLVILGLTAKVNR